MTDHSEVLGNYTGKPVLSTSIVVNKLGDGLSKAVGVEPIVIEMNESAYLAVRVKPTKHRYDAIRNEAGTEIIGYELVQIFDATGAAFTDAKLTAKAVQVMQDKIAEAEALAKSQLSFNIGDLGDEPLPKNVRKIRGAHPDLAAQVDDALKDVK